MAESKMTASVAQELMGLTRQWVNAALVGDAGGMLSLTKEKCKVYEREKLFDELSQDATTLERSEKPQDYFSARVQYLKQFVS